MNDFFHIHEATKVYHPGTPGEVRALNRLSLSLSKGDFVTIVGSNAAGKTTLFNAIAGATTLNSGTMVLDGQPLTRLPEYIRARLIARVRQNPDDSVIPTMTLAENLAMAKLRSLPVGLRLGVKSPWKQEFINLLAPFGIGLEKRIDNPVALLSGGQKQTLALLMATLTEPKLLLLDEHTAALDPRMSKKVLAITHDVVKQHKITTLMITHNIIHAIEYGNRLILLDQGRVVFVAEGKNKTKLTPAQLIEKIEGQVGEVAAMPQPRKRAKW